MYPFLVDNSSEHIKVKGLNKNVLATITHNKYKNILLNKKRLRYLMDNIQSKNYRIGTYEINITFLSWFDDKIYIQSNGYDELALDY